MGEIGNFPPPTTPEEVGARVLMQDRHASKVSKDKDEEDEMQIGSDDEMIDRTGQNNAHSSGDEDEREMVRKIEETKSREGKDNTQVKSRFLSFRNFTLYYKSNANSVSCRLKTWKKGLPAKTKRLPQCMQLLTESSSHLLLQLYLRCHRLQIWSS